MICCNSFGIAKPGVGFIIPKSDATYAAAEIAEVFGGSAGAGLSLPEELGTTDTMIITIISTITITPAAS